MARKSVISRTFNGLEVVAICVDKKDRKTFEKVITLPRVPASQKKFEAACKEIIDTEDIKFSYAESTKPIRKRYGMSEEDFIEHSVELPLLADGESADDEAEETEN